MILGVVLGALLGVVVGVVLGVVLVVMPKLSPRLPLTGLDASLYTGFNAVKLYFQVN